MLIFRRNQNTENFKGGWDDPYDPVSLTTISN